MLRPIFISLAFILSACSGGSGSKSIDIANLEPIELKATDAIYVDAPASDIIFIPNAKFTWLGHIVWLDENGSAWTTTTNIEPAVKLETPKLVQINAISDSVHAGMFIGLDQDSRLKAFLIDPDDNWSVKTPILSGSAEYSGLCGGFVMNDGQGWVLNKDNMPALLTVKYTEDGVVELSEQHVPKFSGSASSCTISSDGSLIIFDEKADAYSLSEDRWERAEGFASSNVIDLKLGEDAVKVSLAGNDDVLIVQHNAAAYKLSITDGLSIPGIDTPQVIAGTPAPMGSVFNQGIIAVAGADHIALIALPYALSELQLASSNSAQ